MEPGIGHRGSICPGFRSSVREGDMGQLIVAEGRYQLPTRHWVVSRYTTIESGDGPTGG